MSGIHHTIEKWLCHDCTIASCNGDTSGLSDEREAEVIAGMDRLAADGGWLSLDDVPSGQGIPRDAKLLPDGCCHCCEKKAHGPRTRFALFPKGWTPDPERIKTLIAERVSLTDQQWEVLRDTLLDPPARKLPPPSCSVVYDRAYSALEELALIRWNRVAPGCQSFADHYTLTPAGQARLTGKSSCNS